MMIRILQEGNPQGLLQEDKTPFLRWCLLPPVLLYFTYSAMLASPTFVICFFHYLLITSHFPSPALLCFLSSSSPSFCNLPDHPPCTCPFLHCLATCCLVSWLAREEAYRCWRQIIATWTSVFLIWWPWSPCFTNCGTWLFKKINKLIAAVVLLYLFVLVGYLPVNSSWKNQFSIFLQTWHFSRFAKTIP